MLKSKKGNVILIVVAVFAVLGIALGFFLKTTVSRKYSAQKLGDTMYARELASSIATLAIHYIKDQLRNQNGDENLRKAFTSIYSIGELKGDIELNKLDIFGSENESSLINTLKKESNLRDIAIEDKIHWILSNFEPIKICDSIPYPREKTGLINISFKIKYKLPSSNDYKTEDYNYVSEIKVVANLLPVLSKFTLYIEKALGDEEPNEKNICCFNVIDTNVNGDLNNSDKLIKPWVLNNVGGNETCEGEIQRPNSYKELVDDKRGFVYIGGGTKEKPICLGIACGDVDEDIGNVSEYGEDFHFYRKSEDEGGYFITLDDPKWDDGSGVISANLGLCNDLEPESAYKEYIALLGEENYDVMKYNSLFKLYGTDKMISNVFSPTLVLGFVNSMYASIRIYKPSENEEDGAFFFKLNYYETNDEYINASDENNEECFDDDLYTFQLAYETKNKSGSLVFDTYLNNYSSGVETVPYNNDYLYCFQRSEAYPIHNTFNDEKLEKLCKDYLDKDFDESFFVKIPNTEKAQYGDIYKKDVKDLTKLEEFINLERLSIGSDSKRISHYMKLIPSGNKEEGKEGIVLEKSDDVSKVFNRFLESKGIFIDKGIDFNGWLYIDSDELDDDFMLPLKFENKKLISQGGIILTKGNISIEDNIEGANNLSHLTLITLGNESKGNIIIKSKVTKVSASLISKNGHVHLEDDIGNNKRINLDIYGNIVMHDTGVTSKKDIREKAGLRRGLRLNYIPELSAIPFLEASNNTEESRSECDLLMFNIKDNPKPFNLK